MKIDVVTQFIACIRSHNSSSFLDCNLITSRWVGLGERWQPPVSFQKKRNILIYDKPKSKIKLSSNHILPSDKSLPSNDGHVVKHSLRNHSTIVDLCLLTNHSTIVEPLTSSISPSDNDSSITSKRFEQPDTSILNPTNVKYQGILNKYPNGIFNPAFTGMILWEIDPEHEFNDYKLFPFHSIRSGVIISGYDAYVFTPISKRDIISYLKILFRGITLQKTTTVNKVCRIISDYIHRKNKESPIPSIPTIQDDISNMLGITDETFLEDKYSYMTLLYRIYIMIFMTHYKMPLQRKLFSTKSEEQVDLSKQSWFQKLTTSEQSILKKPSIEIANTDIPDNLIIGTSVRDLTDYSNVDINSILNSKMFRGGEMCSILFQEKIISHKFMRSISKKKVLEKDQSQSESLPMEQVPTLKILEKSLEDNIQRVKSHINNRLRKVSWNELFHEIINTCNIAEEYPSTSLPFSYQDGNNCGHVLHVDLHRATQDTLYLTMTETPYGSPITLQQKQSPEFIYSVVYWNPIWDLGLQNSMIKKNSGNIFSTEKGNVGSYSMKCVCPCSRILNEWQIKHNLNTLPGFCQCEATIYPDPKSFVKHLYSSNQDFFHRILLRIVQTNYSSILSKIRMQCCKTDNKTINFGKIHKGHIVLPQKAEQTLRYETFQCKV